MAMELSDEQLMANYCGGNKEALEILVRRYMRPLYNFIYRYTGDGGDAEEITQEAFVKVWRNAKRFDVQRSFKTWIFSIAKNATIDFLKKKKAIPFSRFEREDDEDTFSETIADSSPLPDQLFEREGLRKMLTAAMKELSAKYRKVLFLRYNDHFSFREIAEVLQEPVDTVKSRHRRGLIALKKNLTISGEPKYDVLS